MNAQAFLFWSMTLIVLCSTANGAVSEDHLLKNRILIHKKSHWQAVRFQESDQFNLEKIDALSKKREVLIGQLTRLMRESKGGGTRTELGLRLGRLYREKFYLELEKSYQKFQRDVAEAKVGEAPKKPDNLEAMTALDHAIEVFGDLLHGNVKSSRRDQMLYYFATSNLERGNSDRAMQGYKELSDKYPKSPFATEALVELGDHYFDQNQFGKAESYYDQLIQKKYQPLLTYATYKKAWCAYDTDRKEQTLSLLKWIIQNEEHLPATRMKIRTEALHDIPLPFAELRRYNDAVTFFQAFPEPEYRRGLETMAGLFSEQGDHAFAINLWENLLSLDSTHPKNPSYELNVVAAMDLKGDRRGAMNRLTAKANGYMSGSEWAKANTPAKKDTPDATKLFDEAIRKYALSYHATAQKLKNEEYFDLARSLYVKYLELFPKADGRGQIHFNLAEILNRGKHYQEAANHYEEAFKTLPEGDLKTDALRRSLTALDFQVNSDRKGRGMSLISSRSSAALPEDSEENPKVLPMSETETRFLAMAEEYLKRVPHAQDAPDVLYEVSYLHYQHHDFKAARASFDRLMSAYPSHETSYSAARLTLDMLNRDDNYDELISYSKKVLANSAFQRPAFREEVSNVLRQAELKRIQGLEEDDKYRDAADAYLEYVKAYGYQDEALFEKALYNASVDYAKAEAFSPMVETQERFLRRFPKSKLHESVLLQTAKAYEAGANLEKAAPLFLQLATRYSGNPQAKNALRLAGLYYWGSGDTVNAEKAMKAYIQKYPKDAKVVESDLMNMYVTGGTITKAVAYQMQAREDQKNSPAEFVLRTLKLVDLKAQKSGKVSPKLMKEATETADEHSKALMKASGGVEAYSRLLFWEAERDEQGFYAFRFRTQRNLETDLQHKLDLMKQLEADYAKIAALGSPRWGIGAIYKTAAAYRQLALDVMRAPIPADLEGKALESYRNELKKTMIDPFNEKAATFAVRCLDKAEDVKAYTTWTARCYQLAATVDPVKYPVVHTFYMPPLQTALLAPTREEKKVVAGNSPTYAFPFLSSGLFGMALPERSPTTALMALENPPLTDSVDALTDDSGVVPMPTSYRALTDKRKEALNKSFEEAAPAGGAIRDAKQAPSFAYLNLMRLLKPEQAVTAIRKALELEPKSMALHNLLGLAYLEMRNIPAAKVTFLSMIARGMNDPAVWNNLGVVASLEGNEEAAMSYFQKSSEIDNAKEALTNLGFIALKYRSGAEAERDFSKILSSTSSASDSSTAAIGLWVALLQQGKFQDAREQLGKLSQDHQDDPYARISASYFLMDVEKQAATAKQLLSAYMQSQSLENDVQFRRALNQARQLSSSNELPAPAASTPDANSPSEPSGDTDEE